MCDICVMNKVKDKMLSRRGFLGTAAAAGAGAALLPASPVAAAAHGTGFADLTHTLHPGFPTFFGEPQFKADQLFNFANDGFNLFNLTVNEHTGTHVDAPLHFSADGASVDEIPLGQLIAPLCVVDIAARAASKPGSPPTATSRKMPASRCIPAGRPRSTARATAISTAPRCTFPASTSRRCRC